MEGIAGLGAGAAAIRSGDAADREAHRRRQQARAIRRPHGLRGGGRRGAARPVRRRQSRLAHRCRAGQPTGGGEADQHRRGGARRGLEMGRDPCPTSAGRTSRKCSASRPRSPRSSGPEIAKLEKQQGELSEDRRRAGSGTTSSGQDCQEIRDGADFTLAQKTSAGVVVTVNQRGEAQIKRGLVKPEDAKAAKKIEADANPKARGERGSDDKAEPGMSAALVANLTAHRTAGLQAKLSTNSKVALVAVVHALALSVLERSGHSVLQISSPHPNP